MARNPFEAAWGLYRLISPLTLIKICVLCLLALYLTLSQPVIADNGSTSEEVWPDKIDFPQTKQSLPPPPSPLQSNTASSSSSPEAKKRFWPFKHKNKASKTPTLSESQIVNVGPKDPPASPNPILRLAIPFQAEEQTVPAGIYLIQPSQVSESQIELMLTRQGKRILKLSMHPTNANNGSGGVSETPITPTNPNKPQPGSISTRMSEDGSQLVLIYTVGTQQFESQPFPVAIDTKRQLGF